MSAPDMFSPPSLESMIDAANREGFFESSYGLLEKRTAALWKELDAARDALAAEKERVRDMEDELGQWRVLAFQYGTRTEAEKRRETMTLNGRVEIARDLLDRGGDEAINHACAGLAKKLRRLMQSGAA